MIAWLLLALLVGSSLLALRLRRRSRRPSYGQRRGLDARQCRLCAAGQARRSGGARRPETIIRSASADRGAPRVFRPFTPAESWMRMSEALARNGNTADAVGILTNAVRQISRRRAIVGRARQCAGRPCRRASPRRPNMPIAAPPKLAPGNPAGPFFHGLALARSGDPASAVAIWRSVLATAPADCQLAPAGRAGDRRAQQAERPAAVRPRPASKEGRALRRPAGCGSCRPRH